MTDATTQVATGLLQMTYRELYGFAVHVQESQDLDEAAGDIADALLSWADSVVDESNDKGEPKDD
jgi:hypothetical protein